LTRITFGEANQSSSVDHLTSAVTDQTTSATLDPPTISVSSDYRLTLIILVSIVVLLSLVLVLIVVTRFRGSLRRRFETTSNKSQEEELVNSNKKIHLPMDYDYVAMEIPPCCSNHDSLQSVTLSAKQICVT